MARYVPDHRATGHWLRTSRDLWRVCEEAAGEMADIARALAPVGDPDDPWYRHTGRSPGEYVAGIGVERQRGWDGRVGAAVTASAPHSAALEWGNERIRAQAPLAKAAAMMEAYQ